MTKAVYELRPNNREIVCEMIRKAPDGYVVELGEPTRTKDQNAKMWPMLRDLHQQVVYHGQKLGIEEWKDLATASLKQQKFVPNLDGTGFIVVGGRTSTMSKPMFADLIEMIYVIGTKFEVRWSDESNNTIDEYTNAPDRPEVAESESEGVTEW